MGEASDDIKLTSASVIEISRLPGYVLQTKGKIYHNGFPAISRLLKNKLVNLNDE
ncbi:hypothetical protein RND71_034082 [Anisodus tanguticus]|uniref:Uncharacterized protein n=1 Tax=Anisodus tanguticus TaxID=243964 RepID=A0AAE1RA03_9SOLA|nr:hypothetical protein RND71_034082 [Anisodus tanguticus]